MYSLTIFMAYIHILLDIDYRGLEKGISKPVSFKVPAI
jgi:hypothetical protein